jgi:twinkle protein
LDDRLLFRPGELTLWTGASGAGKSQILSDCLVDWIGQGSRICLSSLEMKPEQSLKRMCKQTVGLDRPTERVIRESLKWLDQGLLLYERVGKAGIKGLFEIFDFARAKYGCDQFIIDSLMRLGIDGDDYNAQEKALFEIVDWTLKSNVHVHLVAHSRKGDKDRGVPETEDIKGAMEIGANAFNIVTVWRNRKLEDQIKAAKDDEERRKLEEKPTVIMNIAKQRNGDFEGKVGLWFDQASYQYQSSHDRSEWKRRYLPRGEMVAVA